MLSVSQSETQHGDTWSSRSIVQIQMGESIFPMEKSNTAPDAGTEVIPFADAASAIEALASETARTVLKLLQDEPLPPSGLADRAGKSIQNITYHLEKLEHAGLVEQVATHYSSRGVEMDVYAPAGNPAVICLGKSAGLATSPGLE